MCVCVCMYVCMYMYVVLKNVMFNDKLPTADLSFHMLDEQQCTYISNGKI